MTKACSWIVIGLVKDLSTLTHCLEPFGHRRHIIEGLVEKSTLVLSLQNTIFTLRNINSGYWRGVLKLYRSDLSWRKQRLQVKWTCLHAHRPGYRKLIR